MKRPVRNSELSLTEGPVVVVIVVRPKESKAVSVARARRGRRRQPRIYRYEVRIGS
jgi:hypothetical protein